MRGPGVEPGQIAWKAIVIPLDHPRPDYVDTNQTFLNVCY